MICREGEGEREREREREEAKKAETKQTYHQQISHRHWTLEHTLHIYRVS
jgi:hypothetical protein